MSREVDVSETHRERRAVRGLLPDVLAVATGVVFYFGVRGLTAGSPDVAVANARDIVDLEETLGLDLEGAVQSALLPLEPVTTLANWVYIWGHWPAIIGTLVWLAMRHRLVFRRLRDAMLVSGAMGLCVYTTYPVAPPRLAGLGLVDTVTEQSQSYRVLQPPAFVNQYAAMPSLHVGWDLLVGLAILAVATGSLLRLVGRTMPLAMALSTVVTANHYVLDVLVGAAFGLVGWAVAIRLEQRRAARAREPGPESAPAAWESPVREPGPPAEATPLPVAARTCRQQPGGPALPRPRRPEEGIDRGRAANGCGAA